MYSTKNISKSRVSNKSKKTGFKVKWWMALILVLIVGGVGVAVLRYSQAGSVALVAGSGCTRVNMLYETKKWGNFSRNVCFAYKDNVNNYATTGTGAINPGYPANYCVWGRYYGGGQGVRLEIQDANGNWISGNEYYLPSDYYSVRGFGANWISKPSSTAPQGGNIRMSCVRASTNSIRQASVRLWGKNYYFLDDVTVER